MTSNGLFVCTTCFGLTSAGKGMQRCSCETYQAYPGIDCPNGFHLCDMCAASVAGGLGRYSWNVCEVCLKFNRSLQSKYGVSLPLGRHSIMNGVSISMKASKDEQDEGIEKLLKFIEKAQDLSDWGDLQARLLFESVPMWKNESLISLEKWQEKFALSKVKATSRSVTAFKRFLRIDDLSILNVRDVSE